MEGKTRRRKPQKHEALNETVKTEPSSESQRSSSFSICLFIFKGLVLCLVGYVVYLYVNSPIRPVAIEFVGDKVPLTGVWELNNIIYNGTRLLDTGEYIGPECLVFDDDDNLYTGLQDGRILKIAKDAQGRIGEGVAEEVKLGKLEGGFENERPLGMQFSNGYLYVADSYSGVYKLDVKTGRRELVVSPDSFHPPSKLVDDVTITKDGKTMYVTSASSDFDMTKPMSVVLSGMCTGSIIKVDLETKKAELFKDKLCIANGIQLSSDEKTLLVTETILFRIHMFDVETREVTKIINLPYHPDNITPSKDGGYLVGMPSVRDNFADILNSSPLLRGLIDVVLGEKGLTFVILKKSSATGIAKLNASGDPVKVICDSDSSVSRVATHGIEDKDGNLYIGSFFSPFIVKVDKKFL